MKQLARIENIHHLYFMNLLLFFCFLSSLENQYMNYQIYHGNLRYDICNIPI